MELLSAIRHVKIRVSLTKITDDEKVKLYKAFSSFAKNFSVQEYVSLPSSVYATKDKSAYKNFISSKKVDEKDVFILLKLYILEQKDPYFVEFYIDYISGSKDYLKNDWAFFANKILTVMNKSKFDLSRAIVHVGYGQSKEDSYYVVVPSLKEKEESKIDYFYITCDAEDDF